MNIEVNDEGVIELRQVFQGLKLITSDGETLVIAMRDTGFEITYGKQWYEFKKGIVQSVIPDNFPEVESIKKKST